MEMVLMPKHFFNLGGTEDLNRPKIQGWDHKIHFTNSGYEPTWNMVIICSSVPNIGGE